MRREGTRISIWDNEKLVARIKDKADIMVDSNNVSEYLKYGLFSGAALERQQPSGFAEKYMA